MSWQKEKRKGISAVMMTSAKADQIARARQMTSKSVLLASFFSWKRPNKKRSHSDLSPDQATPKSVMEKDNLSPGFRINHKDKRSSLI